MTGEGEQTLRQKKSAATALNIEEKAVALALEVGFDDLTVDAICAASGVSQRTFFNYFGTKENAILGRFAPSLDEEKVRQFLVSNNPDILRELTSLVVLPEEFDERKDIELKRIQVLLQNPALMGKQLARFSVVADEVEGLIYLRFKRDAPASEPEFVTRFQAKIAAELVAVVFRMTLLGPTPGDPNPNIPMPDPGQLFLQVTKRLVPDRSEAKPQQ